MCFIISKLYISKDDFKRKKGSLLKRFMLNTKKLITKNRILRKWKDNRVRLKREGIWREGTRLTKLFGVLSRNKNLFWKCGLDN